MPKRWAVNPIALARLAVGGAQAGRAWPDSWPDVEDLLRTAYKFDLRAVFYGSGDTPALIDLLRSAADQVPKPLALKAALAVPEVRALAGRLANADWLPRLLPFIVPVSDVDFAPPGTGVALSEHPQIGRYEHIGAMDVGGVSWLDPEQGSTGDCYLVSAMISLAWARPQTWRGALSAATKGSKDPATLNVAFHGEDEGDADPPRFDVPSRGPLDAQRNWIYAHSSDQDETWPALLERTFVLLVRHRTADEPTVADYLAIGNDMFPHEAARILIGGSTVFHVKHPDDKPFGFVAGRCEQSLAKSPTMAWTWDKNDPHATGVDWPASTLVPAHAYAVLGITSQNDRNFVVLRNPYGHNDHIADSPGGEWSAGATRNEGAPVLLDQHGVFAISEDRFNVCFQGVDGVDLPIEPPAI